MVLIDLIVLHHLDYDHDSLVLGVHLEFVRLALHLQLADYALGLFLSRGEGTYIDVEELVGKTAEEEGVTLKPEVLFKVFCCTDYGIIVAGVQKVRSLL